MAGRLVGKVAVITGGGSGIGRDTALRFLEEGARVVIADLNEATARETLDLASRAGHGTHVRFVRTDVAAEADVEAMLALAVREFGRLDCLFNNNAGVAGALGPITHQTVEDWDYTFAVLVRGVFLGVKHGARVLKAQGHGGSIINTASIAGLAGGDGPVAYSAAKAAVINLTRAVALELAPHYIRVNAICPGGIATPLLHRGNVEATEALLQKLQPWPEVGRGTHIAGAALFLATEDARFMTGAALVVDGGLTAAGSGVMKTFGLDQLMQTGAGVDRGTTGLEGTARPVV